MALQDHDDHAPMACATFHKKIKPANHFAFFAFMAFFMAFFFGASFAGAALAAFFMAAFFMAFIAFMAAAIAIDTGG